MRFLAAAVFALLAVVSVHGAASDVTYNHLPAPADPCQRVPQNVTLAGETLTIMTWICGPVDPSRTLLIVLSGATYTHVYWDWPVQPEKYSFMRAAVQAGYTVFNFDHLGVGQSSRPLSALVTTPGHANILHQLIQRLRSSANAYGNTQFKRIVTVGHSLGSGIAEVHAGFYPGDVNGVVLTGLLRVITGVELFAPSYVPAVLDLALANRPDYPYPPVYMSIRNELRAFDFYNVSNADPAIIQSDCDLKDTFTTEELATVFPTHETISQMIHVPVLSVTGSADLGICGLTGCSKSNPLSPAFVEPLFWPQDTCFVEVIAPYMGHDINLHLNSDFTFNTILTWADQYIGSNTHRAMPGCPTHLGGLGGLLGGLL